MTMKRLPIATRLFARLARAAAARLIVVAAGAAGLALSGCQGPSLRDAVADAETADIPRELQKVTIPAYRVEPPDILTIEIVNNIRPAEDPLRAGDELIIRASNLLPVDPMADALENEFRVINGPYRLQTDGTVDFGPEYGSVVLEGLTMKQAKDAVLKYLTDEFGLTPKVSVSMSNVNGKQIVAGEHLIRPDGTVALGVYGSVYVAGMTLDEVKQSVEMHLSRQIHQPEVQVDVLAYNSKVIYVITDGGGSGETVARLPYPGNETVLDAIANISGLSEVSSKTMWVARPAQNGTDVAQTMLVDWRAITQDAVTTTNYQLMPGDRIYIQADRLVASDTFIAKVTAPFARIFGFVLLGNGMVRTLQRGANTGNSNNNTGGGGFF
jgi:polysaccharide biosynthesis/export protein